MKKIIELSHGPHGGTHPYGPELQRFPKDVKKAQSYCSIECQLDKTLQLLGGATRKLPQRKE